ncbi:MAG: MCE family protein [Alphaproteobacteria bacterium]|nr:MCE family protein [Alphaproteobacteria bacterium]
MARSHRQEIGVGLLMVLALALLGWMAIKVGAIGSFEPQVHVVLRIRDAAGLQQGAAVQVAGVSVGTIERFELVDGQAEAHLAIATSAHLPRDVTPRIRSRSLLGEKYVELSLGTAPTPLLADGDVLELPGDQVEIDELLTTLGTLVDRVDLEAVSDLLGRVTDALDADPERLGRMLDHADTLLADGATAARDLPALLDHADRTLDRVDVAAGALDRRLEELRPAIAKGTATLDDLSAAVAPLDDTVAEARQTLADVRALARHGDALLGDLDGVGADLRTVLGNFAAIDKWELRRLLREEGILIRVRPEEVVPEPATP